MTKSDKILIERFEEAYTVHLHKLEFYANSFLQDVELSRGVTQNVFLKLWDRRASLNWDTDMLPLLLTMTRNECLNILTFGPALIYTRLLKICSTVSISLTIEQICPISISPSSIFPSKMPLRARPFPR